MNTTAPAAKTYQSRSGAISITMQFRSFNRMWDVAATRTSGETFGAKFFLTEDEAKGYANELWRTDGADERSANLTSLVAQVTGSAPAPRQDWFQATGQSSRPAPGTLTPKQQGFIASLVSERDVPAAHAEAVAAAAEGTLARTDASPLIDALLALPKAQRTSTTSTTSLPDVPAGHYATPSRTGNNDLDFWRVDRPTEGQWAGRTFVKRVIGGHEDQRVSFGETRTALEAILAAGLEEASCAYGQAIGRCGRCNRHLTDETSRTYGMGPDCRSKGW